MTQRENYLSIIARKGFESIPSYINWCPHLEETCRDKLDRMAAEGRCVLAPLHYTEAIPARPQDSSVFLPYLPDLKPGSTINIYGVGHEPGSAAAMHMTHMRCPLSEVTSVAQLEEYPFPVFEASEELIAQRLAENEALKAQDKIILGDMEVTIWETAWYLRGMLELMEDMMEDNDIAHYIFDWVTAQSVQRAEFYARTGADALFLGDDVGMQQTIMMSKPMYREWIKPRLTEVIAAAKKINPNIVIFYHSCGYVTPFIGDFIEAGVDVLNPVQPECMNFEEIHATYGGAISFHGTIGTQSTMPFGTPKEVYDTVRRNLDIAGSKGGLLPGPTHMLEPEVPWENIEAYLKACYEYTR